MLPLWLGAFFVLISSVVALADRGGVAHSAPGPLAGAGLPVLAVAAAPGR